MQPITLGDFTIRKFVESVGNMPVPAQAFAGLSAERLSIVSFMVSSRDVDDRSRAGPDEEEGGAPAPGDCRRPARPDRGENGSHPRSGYPQLTPASPTAQAKAST